MNVRIIRNWAGANDSLTGDLYCYKHKELVFSCKTMESFAKRIPEGKYICIYNYSPKFDRNLYLVSNVYRRQGIRIHIGNRAKDVKGCICLGSAFIRDTENVPMVTNSRLAMELFHNTMKGVKFNLEIINKIEKC